MKRIITYICILLVLPLLTTFSQAAFVAAAVCSHCTKEYIYMAQPECCAVNVHGAMAVRSAAVEDTDSPCPYGKICQGEDSFPVVAASTHSLETGIAVSHFRHIRKALLNVSEPALEPRPPSLQGLPPLFMLHCSYLI
jgi:hypothetical protein